MSELETIQSALKRARRRCRWQRACHELWRGLFVGSALWAIALITYKLLPIPVITLSIAAAMGLLAVLVGFLKGWITQPTLQQTARWVDERQQLKERLSTALEVSSTETNEAWKTLLITDAAHFASKVEPNKLFPFQLPKISRWALLILALGAGLGFLPEYRTKAYIEKQTDALNIKAAGQKIVEITRQNLERRPPAMEPTRKALESVEQTGLQLAKNNLTRTEALKDLASVTDKLKSDLKDLRTPAVKSLERAARDSTRTPGSVDGEMQKKIDSLQKSLGKATDPAALDQLKNDLQKAQKAAANLPSGDSPAANAARQQMAQTLSDLQQKAAELGQEMPSLDEAIAALQSGKTDNLVQNLDAATVDMEKLKEMAKALQQLQQQAKDGKDLPEQLALGQTENAQKTLQKMMEQLKSSKLSPEQLQKMLDEVSRSVDPASPYGKAAEYLKQSVQELKNSQKTQAAQSLADAAKELQKALDQMQDAQAMMASLDALRKAELAIATCQGWGQRPGDKPGVGNGSKAGRGVGTWAEENGMLYYPDMTEDWDNSGLARPDMDPRGPTDRGDPQLSQNLAPTKLHGQVTPGGPMPSITLKGVSIKGQSSVEYQEKAAAAQSEAQSALNQDQVPRAYQGAVRDYFDDLKK